MPGSPETLLSLSAAPVGVDAALRAASDPSFTPQPTLFKEFSLEDRVAIVTGGGRGLGLEMAEALAEAGATVYCIAKSAYPTDTWKATQAYVSKLGLAKSARLEYVSVDVSDQNAISTSIEQIAQKEGRLDICVASAGITKVVPSLEVTVEQLERTMDINVNGIFYTAQAAGRQMKRLGIHGSIILITSIAGSVALKGTSTVTYDASKAAGIQMVLRSMNISYLEANAELGKLWASQNPLARLGKPSELRGAIVWLASDASSFCVGSDIPVDGGHCAW